MLFPGTTGAQLDQVHGKNVLEKSEPNKQKNRKLKRPMREDKDLLDLLVIVTQLEKILTTISTFMKQLLSPEAPPFLSYFH